MFLLKVEFRVLCVRDGPSSGLNPVSLKDDLWKLSLAIVESGDRVFLKEKGGFLLGASCDGQASCQGEHVL